MPSREWKAKNSREPWYPGEGLVTTALAEEGRRTTLTMTLCYVSRAARDGVMATPMCDGCAETFDRLDELLAIRREARAG